MSSVYGIAIVVEQQLFLEGVPGNPPPPPPPTSVYRENVLIFV
ncbi:MAG: hypothetical protein AAGF01_26310 [Cyanobacteria bacterium P01_G01_bin.38]